jgi:hypothetical protein
VLTWVGIDANDPNEFGNLQSACLVPIAVMLRLTVYCLPCWPPISAWGRLRTGRWIIPGYDKVLVAPALALVLGTVVPELWFWYEPGLRFLQPLFLTAALLIIFNLGPSFRAWCLTAPARLSPLAQFVQRRDFVQTA